MTRSNEPAVWSLFSAGGVVAAFAFPALMIVTGLLPFFGWAAPAELYALLQHPLTRLCLFVCIALPLFHWAHRFRYTVADLGLAKSDKVLPIVCYGLALLGTVLTAVLLIFR
jgi:fumarate reductase subunit D